MEIRRVVAGEFFTNCYVVWGGKPGIAVLIDPADDAPGLLRLLDGLGLIPEAVLLATAAAGGSLGALLGMWLFHHKTRKAKFFLTIPLFLTAHCVLLYLYLSR